MKNNFLPLCGGQRYLLGSMLLKCAIRTEGAHLKSVTLVLCSPSGLIQINPRGRKIRGAGVRHQRWLNVGLRLTDRDTLQDPYNKPLRPIPKTYFVIAIFEAAARALCRTASDSTAAGMILARSNRAKEIASYIEGYYFLTPRHRTCGYRSHVACSAPRERMRAR